jgi:hypothetical protein
MQIDSCGPSDPRCLITSHKIEIIEEEEGSKAALQILPNLESRAGKEKKSMSLFQTLKNSRRKSLSKR